MIKHVIFDVDGTLINTTTANMKGLSYALSLEGIDCDVDSLLKYDGMTGESTLEYFDLEDQAKVYDVWLQYVEEHLEEFEMFYGIETVLEVLHTARIPMYIVTSRTQHEINHDAELGRLLHYFKAVVSADETTKHKPNPDPLLHLLEAQAIVPEETIYIGDSIHDLKASDAAGIRFGKAKWGNKAFEVHENHLIFKTPIDILEIIKRES